MSCGGAQENQGATATGEVKILFCHEADKDLPEIISDSATPEQCDAAECPQRHD